MPSRPIVLFTNALHLGGTAVVVHTLAQAWLAKGVAVEVLVVRREGQYVERFEKNGIPVIGLDAASRNALPVRALSRYLRDRNPRMLIAMGGFRNIIAIAAKMLAGTDTKIVISEHGIVSYHTLNARISWAGKTFILIAYRLGALLLYRFADHAVAVSQHTARHMEKMAFLASGTVSVIYNPAFSLRVIEQSRAPSPHPWLEQPGKTILAAGRLHPVKNFDLLIEAFSKVRQRIECRLIILGDGPEKERLNALIQTFGLQNDVHMAGFAENPYAYMSRADLLVVSSLSEGLCSVLIEAMACGCPVVATDCPGGIGEILEDGRHGTIVPLGDANAMSKAIYHTLTQPEATPKETLIARAQCFSTERSLQSYEALLNFSRS